MIDYDVKTLKEEWEKGPHYYHHDRPEGFDWNNEVEREKLKRYYWEDNEGEIHFNNDKQKALWLLLQGQLSDGQWENSDVDWCFWTKLKVIVDGTLGWKCYDDYIPDGEWPVNIFELEDTLDDYKKSIETFLDIEEIDEETWYDDVHDVEQSMGKSIRKIGYLE